MPRRCVCVSVCVCVCVCVPGVRPIVVHLALYHLNMFAGSVRKRGPRSPNKV